MKKLILLLPLASVLFSSNSYSQGCVMIRSINGFGQYNGLNNSFTTSQWQITASSRYYSSNKAHFEGEDLTPTKENQTVNSVFTAEITVARLLNNGWSLDLTIPYTDGARTSNGEHGGNNTTRYTTRATGLGDIRFMARKWLLAPSINQRGNIQLGLGLKFATGDYKYQDYFHKNDTTVVLSYVNPSIQLGDGGTGIMTELNAYYFLNRKKTLSVYGNVFYMFSPRDQNGVLFTSGSTPKPDPNPAVRALHYENSVPDIWALRAGIEYNLKNWGFSFGMRDEGVPVHDVLGASNGLRRPGYNLAIEPGIIYNQSKFSIFFYLPVFIKNDIKLSVTDEAKAKIINAPVIAPGGSGEYLIFVGAQFRL